MQTGLIFSIYDRKAAYYLPLFTMRSEADAIRQFNSIVTQSDTDVSKYPADYDLVAIGDIDLEIGRIEPIYPARTIINGLVAFQAAQAERARYAKLLSNPQIDIEELIADQS